MSNTVVDSAPRCLSFQSSHPSIKNARTNLAELLEEDVHGQEARQRQERINTEEAGVGDEPHARGQEAPAVEAHSLARVCDPDRVGLKVHGVPQQDHEHAQYAHGVQAQEGPMAGRGREAPIVLAEGEAAGHAHQRAVLVAEQGEAGLVAVLCFFQLAIGEGGDVGLGWGRAWISISSSMPGKDGTC